MLELAPTTEDLLTTMMKTIRIGTTVIHQYILELVMLEKKMVNKMMVITHVLMYKLPYRNGMSHSPNIISMLWMTSPNRKQEQETKK